MKVHLYIIISIEVDKGGGRYLVCDESTLKAPVRQPRRRLPGASHSARLSELLGAKTISEVAIRGHLIKDQTREQHHRLVPLQLSLDL